MDEVVNKLSEKYWNYIISNNQRSVIEAFLHHHKMREKFKYISGREDWRPKQEKIIECLEEVDQDPTESWFITDSVGDVEAAHDIKVQSLAVTWGYHELQRLQKSNPTKIVIRPKEILEIL